MTVLISILAISTFIYLCFLIVSMCGLLKKVPYNNSAPYNSGVSIIIPYRNEGKHISKLQEQLKKYLGSIHTHEVIWVNDHSSDGYEPDSNSPQIKLDLSHEQTGKKAAIKTGIEHASYEHILCLDADIELNEGFFNSLHKHWTSRVHICPVIIKAKGFWSSIWSLESYALCGLTVGMAKVQSPIMNNGAAWAFRKSDWSDLKIRHLNHPSGDDIFTLEAFKKSGTSFSSELTNDALVMVDSPPTLKTFLSQRIRWAGKSSKLVDPVMILFGMATITMYLSLIIGLIYSLFNSFSEAFILILSIKYIIDFSLLFLVSIKAGLPRLLWAYPILSIVYPLYAIFVAFAPLFYRTKWKGR